MEESTGDSGQAVDLGASNSKLMVDSPKLPAPVPANFASRPSSSASSAVGAPRSETNVASPHPATYGADRHMEMMKRRRGQTMLSRITPLRQGLNGSLSENPYQPLARHSSMSNSLALPRVTTQLALSPPASQVMQPAPPPNLPAHDTVIVNEQPFMLPTPAHCTSTAACVEKVDVVETTYLLLPTFIVILTFVLLLVSTQRVARFAKETAATREKLVYGPLIDESAATLLSVATYVEYERMEIKKAISLVLHDDNITLIEQEPRFIGRSIEERKQIVIHQAARAKAADATLKLLVGHYIRDLVGCEVDLCTSLEFATLSAIRVAAAELLQSQVGVNSAPPDAFTVANPIELQDVRNQEWMTMQFFQWNALRAFFVFVIIILVAFVLRTIS